LSRRGGEYQSVNWMIKSFSSSNFTKNIGFKNKRNLSFFDWGINIFKTILSYIRFESMYF